VYTSHAVSDAILVKFCSRRDGYLTAVFPSKTGFFYENHWLEDKSAKTDVFEARKTSREATIEVRKLFVILVGDRVCRT